MCIGGVYVYLCLRGHIWRVTHHLKVTITEVGVTIKITSVRRNVGGPGVKKPGWEHAACRG